jgi:hypothetical protein
MNDISSTEQTQSLENRLLSGQYRIEPEAFWTIARMRGDDGYDIMEPARALCWAAIPSWGRDGWDLGSWPYVVIYHRKAVDGWQIAYYVEGDLTVYSYPSRELRDAATDCLAFWHWRQAGKDWVAGIDSVDVAPDHLRGAFSWGRLDAEAAS